MKGFSETEKEVIYLEIEQSKLHREKAKIVLNKSLVLYVSFMIVGIIGFAMEYIDHVVLNTLIIMGIFILIIGTLPYLIITTKEEKKLKTLLRRLKK